LKLLLNISITLVYLISGTEFHQLTKIPALVHHYNEHKVEKNDITFWKFITMHYASGNLIDADHEKDQELPFKSHDDCFGLNSVASIPNSFFVIYKPALHEVILNPACHSGFITPGFLSCIWQPPKSC
jgi:hypothetical protein